MATRGKVYRCHLFSYSGPQTQGVVSRWTQDLVPIGDEEVLSGEPVELHSEIDGHVRTLTPRARIRFDILERDYLLTGGRDDYVLSLLGTGATQPDADFSREQRTTVHRIIAADDDVAAFLREYRRTNAE